MNCPYCQTFTKKHSKYFMCQNYQHVFYYHPENNSFYLHIVNKNIEVGKDKIGYYMMTNKGLIDISPFKLENIHITLERYLKLMAFS